MGLMRANAIEITAVPENLETAASFIENKLKRSNISGEIKSETLMVFEALFRNLLRQDYDKETILRIKTTNKFGEIDISLGFEGKPYAAILVYIPINAYVGMDTQMMLGEEVVFPLVKLFANAMLMVGAPMTFFSLLKNLTDIYVISERNSAGRRLQIKTIITSVIAVVLAIAAGLIIAEILNANLGILAGYGGLEAKPSIRELIESLVPSDIFTPFVTIMPFPQ